MRNILASAAILFICINNPHVAFSQVYQRERVEYDLDEGGDFSLFAFKKNKKAIVTFTDRNPDNKDEDFVYVHFLNETLQKIKETKYTVSEDYRHRMTYKTDNFLYRFHFSEKKGIFNVVKINSQDFSQKERSGNFNTKLVVDEIICIDNKVFVSALAKKERILFVIDILTGEVARTIPDAKTKEELTYQDMELVSTPSGKEVVMEYVQRKGKQYLQSVYFMYDSLGRYLGEPLTLGKPDEETQLRTGTITKGSKGQYLVSGTYSKDRRGYANGIYLSLLRTGGMHTQTVNFLDIQNFTSYLPERKQEKIEKKKEKKAEDGKELNLDYQAEVHDVVERDGGYLLICEFYYPTYRTETRTTFVNGSARTSYYTVFDGYQYTHAAVTFFDANGNFRWGNAFRMWLEYKPFVVKQFIEANTGGRDTKLTFITGNSIQLNTFDKDGNSTKEKTIESIETGREDDRIKYTLGGDVQYWYGQNFIAYGQQKIKNSEEEDRSKRKRKVFFVSRVEFK